MVADGAASSALSASARGLAPTGGAGASAPCATAASPAHETEAGGCAPLTAADIAAPAAPPGV